MSKDENITMYVERLCVDDDCVTAISQETQESADVGDREAGLVIVFFGGVGDQGVVQIETEPQGRIRLGIRFYPGPELNRRSKACPVADLSGMDDASVAQHRAVHIGDKQFTSSGRASLHDLLAILLQRSAALKPVGSDACVIGDFLLFPDINNLLFLAQVEV